MKTEVKKIIIIVLAFLILEIPVFCVWNWFSDNRVSNAVEEETQLAVFMEPAVPVPAATEAIPATEAVIPEATIPEETTPPETTVPAETEPLRPEISSVPQYYMNDYPEEPYSFSNVAQSGSSMTALAMVATYMTDYEYFPDQMADWLAHFLGGDYQRLEYGSDLLGLSWKRAENIHESIQAAKDGKIVIVMYNDNNMFT